MSTRGSTALATAKIYLESWKLAVDKLRDESHISEAGITSAYECKERFMNKFNVVEEFISGESITEDVRSSINLWITEATNILVDYDNKIGQLKSRLPKSEPGSPTLSSPSLTPVNSPIRPLDVSIIKPEKLTREFTLEEFDRWQEAFKGYYDVSGMSSLDFTTQKTYLLAFLDKGVQLDIERHLAGAKSIYGSDGIMSHLEAHFELKYPLLTEKISFIQSSQGPNEPPSDYARRMIKLYRRCRFGNEIKREEFILLKIMAGLESKKLVKELSKEANLSEEKALKIIHHHSEDKGKPIGAMNGGKTSSKYKGGKKHVPSSAENRPNSSTGTSGNKTKPKSSYGSNSSKSNTKNDSSTPNSTDYICFRCGKIGHRKPECTVDPKSLNCTTCKATGHATKVCPENIRKAQTVGVIGNIGEGKPRFMDLTFCFDHPRVFIDDFKAMADTGASVNVMTNETAILLGLDLEESDMLVTAVGGRILPCMGMVNVEIARASIKFYAKFYVFKNLSYQVICGIGTLERFGIMPEGWPNNYPKPVCGVCANEKRDDPKSHPQSKPMVRQEDDKLSKLKADILAEFPDVFRDDGPLKPMAGPPMSIKLRTDIPIVPRKCPPARAVPIHQEDEATRLLNEYESNGIIERVNHPTKWISPAFFTSKPDGGLRFVTDYSNLNQYVERPIHGFPSPEEITAWIPNGCKYFAKMDAKSGYYQIELDEDSRDLTTFNTYKGRYRYTRAPMGLTSSSDEFCRRSDEALEGLPIKKCVDDVLTVSDTKEEFAKNCRAVAQRCREKGLTLSKSKFEMGTSVKFAGYILSNDGITADPDKVRSINNFKIPTCSKDVRSFLGLANQLGSFITDLAIITDPLRQLLRKNASFHWTDIENSAFEKTKAALTSTPTLSYFDRKKKTILLTDASNLHGLGYALVQSNDENDKNLSLIRCGSRTITETEGRYAPLELECLSIEYGIRKCKLYLLGSSFTVKTDHRPLVGIFKNRNTENLRLQRIMAKIENYHFDVTYVKGKEHFIADALSRYPTDHPTEEDLAILGCLETPFLGDPLVEEIISYVDNNYREVVRSVKNKVKFKDLPPKHPGRQFSGVWNRLSISPVGLLVLDSKRIVIPEKFIPEILDRIHGGHCGIVKTLRLARENYYWPKMTEAVNLMIGSCQKCQEVLPSKPSNYSPIMEGAEYPMESISVDLFDANGKKYMVTTDRFTNYFFVHKLKDTATSYIIDKLQSLFLDYGYPERLRTDGGPQFRKEFRNYCKRAHIRHERSSPYYPESNGHAEAGVRQAKSLIEKLGYGDEYKRGLIDWRNTPAGDGRPSPAQLMFGRPLRHKLVSFKNVNRSPSVPEPNETKFSPGMKVRVQNPKNRRWNSIMRILERRPSGSWELEDIDGNVTTRNERYLRPYVSPKDIIPASEPEPNEPIRRSSRKVPKVNYKE